MGYSLTIVIFIIRWISDVCVISDSIWYCTFTTHMTLSLSLFVLPLCLHELHTNMLCLYYNACFVVKCDLCCWGFYCWRLHPFCCVCHPISGSDTNTSLEASLSSSPQVSRRSKELRGNVFSRLTSQLQMSSSHPSRWLTIASAAISISH